MDCYHVSYAQEWKHGLAQKRIDNLLEMIPEIAENHCIYIDAFLGSRKADQQGVISPYLDHTRKDEEATQRKILRYWYHKGVDPACEHVTGLGDDRFVGLQAHSACQARLIEDVPDDLYCSNPAHFCFDSVTEPEGFQQGFWLEFLPWFYKNHPDGSDDFTSMIDGQDICMPALWCEQPTLIAFSVEGYTDKTWPLPENWKGKTKVKLSKLTGGEPESAGEAVVADGKIKLSAGRGEVIRITSA